jgi:hypothetical protein
VKELVDELNQRAPLLKITCDDINNKVRIIKGQREEEERREVSPAIPFQCANANVEEGGLSAARARADVVEVVQPNIPPIVSRRQQHPLPIEGQSVNFAALGDATIIAAGGRRGRGGEA